MSKTIKSLLIAATIVASVIVPGVAYAYDQSEYTGNGQPQFNAYTSVQNYGNEKDFLRVGPVNGTTQQFSNNMNVCEGEVRLTLYVHNSAPEGFNGTNMNGTGVATGTKVAVNLPTSAIKEHEIQAVISANNAASVTDKAKITCATDDIQVEYVPGSAVVITEKNGTRALADTVASGGALIGTYANDGIVPGCWEFRNYITVNVRVKKHVKPVTPTPQPPVRTTTVTKPATLAKTGPGEVVALFAGVSAAGAIAHRAYAVRKYNR